MNRIDKRVYSLTSRVSALCIALVACGALLCFASSATAQTPTPTPNASPTPNATPNATPTPNASPTPNATPTPGATPAPTPNAGGEVRIEAALIGAAINGTTPKGEAKFEARADGRRKFEAEVENINLPAGTVLNVLVDNVKVGTLTLDALRQGELELENERGQTVPQVGSRTRVVITDAAGATIVAGAFSEGVSPNPSPTPSGNVETRIEARLAGAAVGGLTPRGEAELRVRDGGARRQFKVEIEKVNLPVGTRLNVLVDGVKVGELVVGSLLEAELELESEHGSFIPVINNGSTIIITNQAGATIVSGSFNTSQVVADGRGNDIDDSRFFVEKQYHDFFDREPDDRGLDFWTHEIEDCGTDAPCIERKRINTSGAFFLSIEFQETGFFVYRLYQVSFGRRPTRLEFITDMQIIGQGVVVGAAGWEQNLTANRQAFIEQWTARAAFKSLFDGKTNEQYVDALFANAGVTPTTDERAALVTGLNSGTETRASVLRKVAEHAALIRKEFNPAFVAMQYFGYLHRDPDDAGFNFWLNKLDEFGGDFHKAEMVKAFIVSGEYRGRFDW